MADVTPNFGFPYPEGTDLVRDGAQDIQNLAEALDGQLSGGFQFAGLRRFTADGTFDKADPFDDGNPDGLIVRAVRVRVQGGGGGGGGAAASGGAGEAAAAGGGNGGNYAESFIEASTLGSTVAVTVGTGGAGGAAGAPGGNGTTSQFGTLVVAEGGNNGAASAVITSANTVLNSNIQQLNQTANTGQIVIFGQSGGVGMAGMSGSLNYAGFGGNSQLGAGGRGGSASTNDAGQPGTAFGGGGSGGHTRTATGHLGGDGAGGIVIVEVFV